MATVNIYRIAISEGNRTLAILGIPGTQGVFYWFGRTADYSPAVCIRGASPLTAHALADIPLPIVIDLLNSIIQRGGSPE